MQGRFKNTISFADVYVGQIFTGHLNCAPPDWLLALLLPIMQAISPGLKMDLGHPENPYLLSPLMSTMQSICINQPGHEPGILDLIGTTRDDLNILDKELNIFSGMDIQKRKTYFSNIENLNQFQFDPSLVYSFGFFQHIINMTNRLIEPMPFVTYSLDHVLDQRPIQFMAAVLPSQQFFEPTASCTSSLDDKRNIGASPNPSPNISPDPKPATNRLSETKLKREPVHKMLEWKYIFDVKVCKAEN